MIRTVNFLLMALTGFVCLGLYRVAEETRVARAELVATEASIASTRDELAVLEAEWAHLTQPARVQALASRHLRLSDAPVLELSSLTQLPRRGDPTGVVLDKPIRQADAVISRTGQPRPKPRLPQAGA